MNQPALEPRWPWRHWRHGLVTLVAGLLLAACGGGTSQYDPFQPQRMFSFGDEASALGNGTSAPLGRTWSVNGLDANGNFDCTVLPIWTQSLAGLYGFVFAECNPNNVAVPQARTFAARGAKVADLATQIEDARLAAGGFNDKDIATLFVGTNDIVELYGQYPQRSEAELLDEARARGELAAQRVNQIIALGAKVIVANLPDLSLSPFAARERANNSDIDRAGLISRLTAAFNQQLGVKILLDGRFVGLVQIDQRSQAIARVPSGFGFLDVTTALCTTAPPDCTTGTMVANGSAGGWLWADDRWFATGGHNQMANMAIDRARRNPF